MRCPPRHGRLSPLALTALLCGSMLGQGCDKARFLAVDAGLPPGVGATIPGPPAASSEGPDLPVHVWVLRDVILRQGNNDLWRSIGWNLDGRCSYPPDPDGDAGVPLDGSVGDAGALAAWDIECAPQNPGEAPAIDGDDCRDNTYGQFLSLGLDALPIDAEGEAREAMADGRFAFMVRMHGYNGTPNDPLVVIEVVQTAWGVPEGGERGEPLAWDGTDTFFPATQAFDERGQPFLLDRAAYVVDGQFVMRVPPASDFRFAGTNVALAIRVRDATITGQIDEDSGRLEGVVLSARWAIDDILNELNDLGVCEGSMLRDPLERSIRRSADLLANPESRPGALVGCDAVSAGIGFTGYPGRWGRPNRLSPVRPQACGPREPDAGPFDGGPDAGPFDGGPDAGPFDAGPPDAGSGT